MSLVINTNISSMKAQSNISKSKMMLDQTMERLSSGKRINSAKDDAAGLAISNRLSSQVRGLNQAVRNANDGISLIQTAEGALGESTNILQRMRELAVQSANGTYTSGNRASLNAETQQLIKELDRIAETTTFNGRNILDGSMGEVKLQVGSEANQTIGFKIQAMDAKTLGMGAAATDVRGTAMANSIAKTTIADGAVYINNQNIGAFPGPEGNTLNDLLNQITKNVAGVTASGFNSVEASTVGTGSTVGSANHITMTVVDANNTTSTYTIGETNNLKELAEQINTKTGGNITAEINDDGKLVLSNNTGASIALSGANAQAATGIATGTTYQGKIALTSDDGSDITISAGPNGSAKDLAALGFTEARAQGTQIGEGLYAGSATTALAYGDLKINGVIIDHKNTNTLQGKVDNINAASSETGVTASLHAEVKGSVNLAKQGTELATTGGATANFAAVTLNGVNVTLTAQQDVNVAAREINDASSSTGVSARTTDDGRLILYSEGPINIGGTGLSGAFGATSPAVAAADNPASTIRSGDTIKLNGQEVALGDVSSLKNITDAINSRASDTGVTAKVDEQGRIALSSNASFTVQAGDVNGGKVLAALGLSETATTQAEAKGTLNLTATGAEMTTAGSGAGSIATGGATITLNGTSISLAEGDDESAVATKINAKSIETGVYARLDTSGNIALYSDDAITLTDDGTKFATAFGATTGGTAAALANNDQILINGTAVTLTTAGTFTAQEVVDSINNATANTGVKASINEDGSLALTSDRTFTIAAGNTNGGTALKALGFSSTATTTSYKAGLQEAAIQLKSTSGNPIMVDVTANGAAATGLKDQNLSATGAFGAAVSSVDISTQAGAQKAIKIIDKALETVNDVRADMGAVNNRLDFTINNLSSQSVAADASRSRIEDADFAAETAVLSRSQVLQQASQAMLAQANSAPQQVLSLLR